MTTLSEVKRIVGYMDAAPQCQTCMSYGIAIVTRPVVEGARDAAVCSLLEIEVHAAAVCRHWERASAPVSDA